MKRTKKFEGYLPKSLKLFEFGTNIYFLFVFFRVVKWVPFQAMCNGSMVSPLWPIKFSWKSVGGGPVGAGWPSLAVSTKTPQKSAFWNTKVIWYVLFIWRAKFLRLADRLKIYIFSAQTKQTKIQRNLRKLSKIGKSFTKKRKRNCKLTFVTCWRCHEHVMNKWVCPKCDSA